MLLGAGASVDKANDDGVTPLLVAAAEGNVEVVDELVKAGARVNHAMNGGATAVFLAAEYDNFEVLHVLVKAGADTSVKLDGHTALSIAQCNGNDDIVDLLDSARTQLHIAARKGELEAVREMLEATADFEAADESGLTALDLAISEGNAKCAALLEEAMLPAWDQATESIPAMESYVRAIAKKGDATKLAVLLERCKAINIEAADKVG